MEAVEVDELPDAAMVCSFHHSQQRIVDLREQALIALIGPSTLINTAKGELASWEISSRMPATLRNQSTRRIS